MPGPSSIDALAGRSPRLFRLFRWYAGRYVARHVHAVRIARDGPMPDLGGRPAVIVLNHPSWWDPLIALLLTGCLPEDRLHYAPIESIGLAQYAFLARVGFFGVDSGSTAGALRFLRTSLAILDDPRSVIWITGQGAFVDPRARPTRLRPGIGHLASRLSNALIVPMAIEYPFWSDRGPEALVRFGRPMPVDDGRARSPRDWTAAVERALEEELDALAAQAVARDPATFETLLAGTAGVGGVYDTWRRLRAWLVGRSFDPEHATRPPAGVLTRPVDRSNAVPGGRNPTV